MNKRFKLGADAGGESDHALLRERQNLPLCSRFGIFSLFKKHTALTAILPRLVLPKHVTQARP